MITKTIKFVDYEGNERSKECRFHLSKHELMEMNFSETGGLEKTLKTIVNTEDFKKMVELFKDVILKSYGEMTPDGMYFVKVRDGHRLADDFAQTPAFDELYMELATDDKAAADFFKGILPKGLADQLPANLPEN